MPVIEGAPTLAASSTFFPATFALITSAISYWLNKAGRYELALWFYITMFIIAPWWAVLRTETPVLYPIGILMLGGNLMASTLSRNWYLLIFSAVLSLGTILALPYLSDISFADSVPLLSVVGNLNVIILILSYYRNRLENARLNERIVIQNELQQRTNELEEYQEKLETKVQERTHELVKANQELKDLQDQLVQSEKMAALGTITAGVAHELNNPLQFIQSGTFILRTHLATGQPANDELHEAIASIENGVRRASKIIKSLDYFSLQRAEGTSLNDPHVILEDCLSTLESSHRKSVKISREFSPERSKIKGDASDIHQIFHSIIINAIQAIKDKGKVLVKTWEDDKCFALKVSDTGVGISPKHLKKVFDPFFTTKDPGAGTGLGLSITHRLIDNLHGKIMIDSKLDIGTNVTILIPKKDG